MSQTTAGAGKGDVTSYTTSQVRSSYRLSIAAFADAQAAGTLFVFAAGNSGNSEVSIDAGCLIMRLSLLMLGWWLLHQMRMEWKPDSPIAAAWRRRFV